MTIIGIDFGLTKCCIAVWDPKANRPHVISRKPFDSTTPAKLTSDDGEATIQSSDNTYNNAFEITQLLCKNKGKLSSIHGSEINLQIKDEEENLMSQEQEDEYQQLAQVLKPEALLACLFYKLKQDAEDFLQETVAEAVVALPASLQGYHQRSAIKAAAEAVGLQIVRMISDGAAAVLTFGLSNISKGEKNILAFSLDRKTLELSVATIEDGFFEMKASVSDTNVGNVQFGNIIVDYFILAVERVRPKLSIRKDSVALAKLQVESERLMVILSTQTEAHAFIKNLVPGINFEMLLTRSKFGKLCGKLFRGIIASVQNVLRDAQIDRHNIDKVVLLGKSNRIPKVRQLLQAVFLGKELNESLHPDEAVACGASIQAGILSGSRSPQLKDILLLDITHFSVGIETTGGIMTTIIPRNTVIPSNLSQTFNAAKGDYKDKIHIKVFEGEKAMVKDNTLIGQFVFNIFPGGDSEKAEVPTKLCAEDPDLASATNNIVEVFMEFDADLILRVGVNKQNSKPHEVEFDKEKRLSADEIARITELLRLRDKESIELEQITARNKLMKFVAEMGKTVSEDLGDRFTFTDGQKITKNLHTVSEWMKSTEDTLLEADDYLDRLKLLKDILKGTKCINFECKQVKEGNRGQRQ